MGQSQLLTAGIAALTLVVAARAQGPIYRERWNDLHLQLLRERVQHESRGRDLATLTAAAELLAAVDTAAPFRPAARALAHLRGVEADAAFVLRASLGAFVLPEVVDPAAEREDCRSLHVSVQLPYSTELPGVIGFEVEVFDAAGARVHRAVFGDGAAVEDLRMAYTTTAVPGEALGDGRYRLRLRTTIDGKPPRAQDPVLEHGFSVLRGYGARAAEVLGDGRVATAALAPLPRSVLTGMLSEVERAFRGEAFDGVSDAVADLERAERAIASVGAGKPPQTGCVGIVPLALPTGGEAVLGAVVAFPADTTARPLVVVAGAAPAFDVKGHRPAAPEARSARWLQRRVADLGLGAAAHVAWLQSPGLGLDYAKALPSVLEALRELLPTDGRIVLVAELEAAVAVCYAPAVLRRLSGLVLVGAGALPQSTLRGLGELPILGVPLSGHDSGKGLSFTAAVARGEQGAVDWQCRFELVADGPRPWTFGAAAAAAEIAAFVRALPPPR